MSLVKSAHYDVIFQTVEYLKPFYEINIPGDHLDLGSLNEQYQVTLTDSLGEHECSVVNVTAVNLTCQVNADSLNSHG